MVLMWMGLYHWREKPKLGFGDQGRESKNIERLFKSICIAQNVPFGQHDLKLS